MADQKPPNDAQKKRAQRLRAKIDDIGVKPSDGPRSPRELTDEAAREAAQKSGNDVSKKKR